MLSLEAFSRLTASIHEAALLPGRWDTVVSAVTREIGGTIGGFVLNDPGRGMTIAVSTADADAAKTYHDYYGRIDPIVPALATFSPGTVVHDSMIMPVAEIRRTEFYNEWVRPQGVNDCCVGTPLSIGRTFSAFLLAPLAGRGAADRLDTYSSLLPHLVPHLQAAVRTTQLVGKAADESDRWHALLDRLDRPIYLLARDGKLIHANTAGEQLLRDRDGLAVAQGLLVAPLFRETLAIRDIIGRAAAPDLPSGGSCVVTRPSGRGRLVLTATPVPAGRREEDGRFAVALLVSGLSPPSSAIQKLLADVYELTPAEARLAQTIANGVGVKEAARALAISPSTARTHLLRIFQKTGVRRQAELAHVVTELATS
jgi:DNA-binding CsgD family transcriptional regulator